MPYIHHVPGRLRVRSAVVRRNQTHAAAVRNLLRAIAGVRRAEANPLTGSITIHYNSALTNVEALLAALREKGYLSEVLRVPAAHSSASGRRTPLAGDVGSEIARKVVQHLVEKVVERSVAALVAAVL